MQVLAVLLLISQFFIGNLHSTALIGSQSSKAIQTFLADKWSVALEALVDMEDAKLNVPELITKYGYPVEVHHITTEDGYILEAHRIPYGKKCGAEAGKEVVWLQHGLLGDSSNWVITGVDNGLGYLLADACYDVWLGNARGNTYSKGHVSLSPVDDLEAFWTFSWHEMGIYDLPAVFDYVLKLTGKSELSYAGHSMGTTMFWVCMSERPQYNDKIKLMSALAPVAYMTNIRSPILRGLAPIAGQLEDLLQMIGWWEFLPATDFLENVGATLCDPVNPNHSVCSNILFIICGANPDQMDAALLPVIVGHSPAGTSSRALMHYAQMINTPDFRQFDFGKEKNIEKYGTEIPPAYSFANVTAPVALYWGDNDWLADVGDVHSLAEKLPNLALDYRMKHNEFNHLDFIFALDVKSLVNDPIMEFMKTGLVPTTPGPSTTEDTSAAVMATGFKVPYLILIISSAFYFTLLH